MSTKSRNLNSTPNHVINFYFLQINGKDCNTKIHKILKLIEMVMTFHKTIADPYIKQPKVHVMVLQLHETPNILIKDQGPIFELHYKYM